MSNREQVEAEARERRPDPEGWDYYNGQPADDLWGYEEEWRNGFVAGRTVAAELVDDAACDLWVTQSHQLGYLNDGLRDWARLEPCVKEPYLEQATAALRGANLIVEGAGDE